MPLHDDTGSGRAAQAVARLVDVVARLRGPGGCPWDREQTVSSVRRHLLAEAYELLEALDRDQPGEVLEELGDVLFQVAFLGRLYQERDAFDLGGIADAAARKMVARHPHVFGDERLDTADEVLRSWARLKAEARGEQPGERSVLDGIPKALPALEKALELGDRTAREGFDWPDVAGVLAKLDEERGELVAALREGLPAERVVEELGDLLFAAASLGRKLGIDPELALQRANAKFDRRYRAVERAVRERGGRPGLAELEELWQEAKRAERDAPEDGAGG